jgi:O-antigen/teichoic acid export membrane protein
MSSEAVELIHAAGVDHPSRFYRQSSWMMVTSVGSGVLMSLVHILSKFIPDSEYAAFGTLLQFVNWIAIPAIGLGSIFTQQTSAVTTLTQKRQLVGTIRAVMLGTSVIWLILFFVCVGFQSHLLHALKISNPAALWMTIALGLVMLWLPIIFGLLQGRQNFLWLGWAAVCNGAGRVLLAAFIVLVLGGWAAGMMAGAFLGASLALSIGLWHNRDLLWAEGARFHGGPWLKTLILFSLGCGVSQFLFSADLIAVQTHLTGTAPYVFGGTLARALVLFTSPLVAVMFPKVAHSVARKKKTDLMLLTLGLTAVLAAIGALGLTFCSPLLIRILSKEAYVSFVPLMPLFAFSMVPLALGNVLMNNLMAHARFACVPALIVIAVGYWIALQYFHDSFRTVIQVLGIFNLIYLATCAFYTWVWPPPKT